MRKTSLSLLVTFGAFSFFHLFGQAPDLRYDATINGSGYDNSLETGMTVPDVSVTGIGSGSFDRGQWVLNGNILGDPGGPGGAIRIDSSGSAPEFTSINWVGDLQYRYSDFLTFDNITPISIEFSPVGFDVERQHVPLGDPTVSPGSFGGRVSFTFIEGPGTAPVLGSLNLQRSTSSGTPDNRASLDPVTITVDPLQSIQVRGFFEATVSNGGLDGGTGSSFVDVAGSIQITSIPDGVQVSSALGFDYLSENVPVVPEPAQTSLIIGFLLAGAMVTRRRL